MKCENGVYYTDVGKGDIALVFLHYFGGSCNTWQKVIAELSHQFRCIAIDLPGFGNSQGKWDPLSVTDCATQVAQVINVPALKQYVLVGHSMGGKIALSLAAMQPSGLRSMVLIAPSPPTPEPMGDKAREHLLHAYGNRLALETLANSITAHPLPKPEIKNIVADNLRVSQAAWNWWAEAGSREDISAQMSAIQVPVFVISGEMDTNFSSSFLRKEMTRYFPSASFAEIQDAGHLLPVETPSAVATLIREFSGR